PPPTSPNLPNLSSLYSQILHQKRHPVRLLLDHLARRLARTVSRLRLDLDQHRLRSRLRGLERRRELERVARHHAIVVIGRRDERRGVLRARPDVVERRI